MAFPQPATLMKIGIGQSATSSSKAQAHIVKASHGFAFEVKKGDRFRIVDLYGEQVIDFAAWVKDTDLVEKLSMAYTRSDRPHQRTSTKVGTDSR